MPARHSAPALIAYATALLLRAGLDADKAATVAAILVEADLLGHTTHGLALLPAYLAEIEKGAMTKPASPASSPIGPLRLRGTASAFPGLGSSCGPSISPSLAPKLTAPAPSSSVAVITLLASPPTSNASLTKA